MNRVSRILIADDEPNIRMTVKLALESEGHEVIEAEDGEEVVEILTRTSVDLAIIDVRMPRLGGIEALKHLREIGNPTPVILLTAHGGVAEAVAAMKLGASDFLLKPMTPESLRRKAAEAISLNCVLRPKPTASTCPKPPSGMSYTVIQHLVF